VTDIVAEARVVADLLERGDIDAVMERLSERPRSWPGMPQWLRTSWAPALDEIAGVSRSVTDAWVVVPDRVARLRFAGDAGAAIATFSFDDAGVLIVPNVTGPRTEGIANVVIGTPIGDVRRAGELYASLLGWKIVRDDWIKIAKSRAAALQFAFGDGWSDERPPRWPDPEFPQQLHIDVLVRDVEAVGAEAVALGATLLQDCGAFRTYADPWGHPFCLYADATHDREVARVVIDVVDPERAAAFYAALLQWPHRVEDTDDRIVIADADLTMPMLAFQRAEFVAPRWPDDAYPEVVHLDLTFDDARAAQARAESLGAVQQQVHGSAPVYLDPDGHPFCLGGPGS
jgi:predicted enzyme related to lactoylglutathione lyase